MDDDFYSDVEADDFGGVLLALAIVALLFA